MPLNSLVAYSVFIMWFSIAPVVPEGLIRFALISQLIAPAFSLKISEWNGDITAKQSTLIFVIISTILIFFMIKRTMKTAAKAKGKVLFNNEGASNFISNAYTMSETFEVDTRDIKTPDNWVKRHPDLVRLTGAHPFNCEAPLEKLRAAGFITPPALHYVRNHGAVPAQVKFTNTTERKVIFENWRISISGLVDNPVNLTIADLMSLKQHQLPVLLVCAGNRRKEQNSIRKTIGFNWGASGLSCNVWKGVRLCDVLKLAKVKSRAKGAAHVCFSGPKHELPQGPDGDYATSIDINTALDPAQDVLIAYQQNGQLLEPDHGFPVRIIIPGYIGGRMIKWLTEIKVTSDESDNFYHFRDNRVLPVGVTPESAEKEGWWFKPEYIINQLNINSAMWGPAHNSTVMASSADTDNKITLSGYAYSGNGVKVTRVEVSFDNGTTWHLTETCHPESPTEYGKYWCWCFWSFETSVGRVKDCGEFMCRAWDACQNTQPKDLTWNVMGMMNNPWFRIKVHQIKGPEGGVIALKFEHPTLPGTQKGGWMSKEGPQDTGYAWKKTDTGAVFGIETQLAPRPTSLTPKGEAPKSDYTVRPVPADAKKYTMAEVDKHISEDDCWVVIKGLVYDATEYLKVHPGGPESILMVAGMEANDEFEAIHSKKAWALLDRFCIGTVADDVKENTCEINAKPMTNHVPPKEDEVALKPRKKVTVTLDTIEVIGNDGTNDVIHLKLALPSPDMRLGLPTGQHFLVYADIGGKNVARAYTPVSNDSQKGAVDLVVKAYQVPGKEGKMSSHMAQMKVGDTLQIKGPLGRITYSTGQFKDMDREISVKHVGMIAGGTGITPMYQVLQTALLDPEDTTCFYLLYANQSNVGVMLQEDLDNWAKMYPGRIKVHYVVDKITGTPKRKYLTGYISEQMVRECLSTDTEQMDLVLLCGPPVMIERACLPNLEKANYPSDKVLHF